MGDERQELPPTVAFEVTLINRVNLTINAHKVSFTNTGDIVFLRFDYIAGLTEPGFVEVAAFATGRWTGVLRQEPSGLIS